MSTADAFAHETLPWLPELRGVARRYFRGSDVAEDLVQETFLRALQARDRYRPGTNARAWLHTILLNAARGRYRRDRRERRLRDRLEHEGRSVEDSASVEARPGAPLSWLEILPPGIRQAVQLVDVEGKSYAEAAQTLGCPIGTVMSRLHRGRRRLRDRFHAEGRAER